MAFENSTSSTEQQQPAPSELAAFAYDSVLLLAAALSTHNLSNDLQLTADDVMRFSNTNDHYGATGSISFDGMGRRLSTEAYVTLYRETADHTLDRVLVGIVNKERESQPLFTFTNNESHSTIWSGLCLYTIILYYAHDLSIYEFNLIKAGDESPPVRIVINRLVIPLTVIYYTLAVLGILLAIFCICFNLKYRNCKYVISSRPK